MPITKRTTVGWILLVYQLPTHPSNLRVRVWRKLQQLGAVALKNSVYILPDTDANRELCQWLAQQVRDAGGDASLFRTRTLIDLTDRQIISEFQKARSLEYTEVIKDLRRVERDLRMGEEGLSQDVDSIAHIRSRLKTSLGRLEQIRKIDFFGAPNLRETLRLAESCRSRMNRLSEATQIGRGRSSMDKNPPLEPSRFRGRVWATRPGLHIDRLGCAWLIRRQIDPKATFRFFKDIKDLPKGSVPFDMTGVVFGHHGEECSFETFLRLFGLADPALRALGDIIHDVDLKDEKYGRPETPGVEAIINGMAATGRDDRKLISACEPVFEALFRHIKKQIKPSKEKEISP